MIGLSDALQYLTGYALHEDKGAYDLGIKIITHLRFCVWDMGKKHGMKITIEESPAESAARRLAKIDMKRYPDAAAFVRGSVERDEVYYTNSIHFVPEADVDLVTRIQKQAKFHSLIESGAIIHAFVGESRPSAGAIASLVRKTFEKTNAAQLTISPEFTICKVCHHTTPGDGHRCARCGATDIPGVRRMDADERPATGWNRAAFQELERVRMAKAHGVKAKA